LTRYLTKADLPHPFCELSDRTLDRWAASGLWPYPKRAGNLRFWTEDAIASAIDNLPEAPREVAAPFTRETATAAINKRWKRHRERLAAEQQQPGAAAP